jgi:hypothetical protein
MSSLEERESRVRELFALPVGRYFISYEQFFRYFHINDSNYKS